MNAGRFLISFLVVLATPAGAFSLWDVMPTMSINSKVSGYVKMIAVDEAKDTVFVKIDYKENDKTAREETFQLCNPSMNQKGEFHPKEMMELLRAAFQRNEKVQLEFSSMFSRCISRVSQSSAQVQAI